MVDATRGSASWITPRRPPGRNQTYGPRSKGRRSDLCRGWNRRHLSTPRFHAQRRDNVVFSEPGGGVIFTRNPRRMPGSMDIRSGHRGRAGYRASASRCAPAVVPMAIGIPPAAANQSGPAHHERVWPYFGATVVETASRRLWAPNVARRRFYNRSSRPPCIRGVLAKKYGHTPTTNGPPANLAPPEWGQA